MSVIGHAANNGHLSFIYELSQDDFLRAAADAVHAAHPFHLVGGLERFGHTLPLHHGGFDGLQTFTTGCVYFLQMGKQLFRKDKLVVETGAMILQVCAVHPAVLADVVFLRVRQDNIRNVCSRRILYRSIPYK